MIRVMIVEDQTMLRESLATAIDIQEDMCVVGKISDATELTDLLSCVETDLILMDVCTENDSSGIVATRKVKEAYEDIKVLIMTGMPEVTFVEQAQKAQADSFVYKNVSTKELMAVIRSTMDGYSTFPQQAPSIFSDTATLTETEMEILRLVCKMKTRKEIAAELYLSESTVKRHISAILAKTGYDNILRLAIHAVANGNIVPEIGEGE